jgi:cytidylate kinase
MIKTGMKDNVVFSGRLGSGKTTISRAVAEVLQIRWNSFGSVTKKIAREQQMSIERESLQDLGEYLVTHSAEEFCRRVLTDAEPLSDTSVVIDGLRHSRMHKILREISKPRQLISIYIDLDDAIRFDRLRNRGGLCEDEVRKLESHSTELEVSGPIRRLATFTVNNSGSINRTVETVIALLR